jgi:hypothetical protein
LGAASCKPRNVSCELRPSRPKDEHWKILPIMGAATKGIRSQKIHKFLTEKILKFFKKYVIIYIEKIKK